MFLGRPWPRPGEPLWLDDDQDKVAAYLRMEREVCPSCGTAEGDWIDPATKQYLERPKWEADALRCYGCAEMEAARSEVPAGQKGVRIVLVRAKDEPDDENDDLT